MKLSSIALFTILIGTGQLTGCASTETAPAGNAEQPTATGSTSTKPATSAEEKPAAVNAEPECN